MFLRDGFLTASHPSNGIFCCQRYEVLYNKFGIALETYCYNDLQLKSYLYFMFQAIIYGYMCIKDCDWTAGYIKFQERSRKVEVDDRISLNL